MEKGELYSETSCCATLYGSSMIEKLSTIEGAAIFTSRAAAESYVTLRSALRTFSEEEEGTFCFFAFECIGKHIKSE